MRFFSALSAMPADGNKRGKPLEKRLEEAMEIYRGLGAAGVDAASIAAFKEAAGRFVRTGKAESGSLDLPGTANKLVYDLTSDRLRDSSATIKRRIMPA